jgi:protein SCO1/2
MRTFVPLAQRGDVIPDVPLVDQDGDGLSLRRPAGSTIVSFVYTRCPDRRMCSLVTAKFAQLARTLGPVGIRLVEITLDPDYDRPAVLRRYADAAGARGATWRFGTGRAEDVRALAERFGIVPGNAGDESSEATEAAAHTEAVAIVSATGVLESLIEGNAWSADDVAAEARAIGALPSNPWRRFALALFTAASAVCGGGSGGIPLAGALAIFAASVLGAGWTVLRVFVRVLRNDGKAS